MTVLIAETFEGQPNGTVMTTGNSAFNQVVQAGWTFSNAVVESLGGGTQSGKVVAAAATAQAIDLFSVAKDTVYAQFYFYLDAIPAANTAIAQLTSAGTQRGDLRVTTTGTIHIRNSASTAVATSPAITAGSWVRVRWLWNNTTAQQQLQVFTGANLHSATPTYDSGLVAATTGGTSDRFLIGVVTSSTLTAYFDNVTVDDAVFAAPSYTAPTNVAPTVNAGADQANVEPWSTVTLTATASDADGTTPTVTWAQTAGTPAVTLSGTGTTRTFTAPGTIAGTTLTFTATASDGTLSATDAMTVAVLPVNERAVIGGVEVPMRIMAATL